MTGRIQELHAFYGDVSELDISVMYPSPGACSGTYVKL